MFLTTIFDIVDFPHRLGEIGASTEGIIILVLPTDEVAHEGSGRTAI